LPPQPFDPAFCFLVNAFVRPDKEDEADALIFEDHVHRPVCAAWQRELQ
jgi:hypothetical protein